MKKETAYFNYSVDVECPHCNFNFDLIDNNNDDGVISTPIFNNEWDELKGIEVNCYMCGKTFEIEEVLY